MTTVYLMKVIVCACVGEYKNIFEGAGLNFLAWDPFFQISPNILCRGNTYYIIKILKSDGDWWSNPIPPPSPT